MDDFPNNFYDALVLRKPRQRSAALPRLLGLPVASARMIQPPRPSPPAKIHEKRRGVRLNSRVPVAVEWGNPSGASGRAQAFTRMIGPYGCLMVLPADLSVDQRVIVVNLATERSNPAVIVWKGSHRAEGWELGIELTQPPMDFWGLEL